MPTKPISNSALRDATAHSQNVVRHAWRQCKPKLTARNEKKILDTDKLKTEKSKHHKK